MPSSLLAAEMPTSATRLSARAFSEGVYERATLPDLATGPDRPVASEARTAGGEAGSVLVGASTGSA